MEPKFFLLNIKHPYEWTPGLSAAEHWLEQREAAPIFYGDCTIGQIRDGLFIGRARGEEPLKFVNLTVESLRDGVTPIFITIDSGSIWLYSPKAGPFEDSVIPPTQKTTEDRPKYYEIKIIRKLSAADAPLVLSGMRVNRWLSSGTFVPLQGPQYRGNLEAARTLLNLPAVPIARLECLSSVEFETLVAKIFEEHGFFVPAYRGGVIDGFDLIAEPTGKHDLTGIRDAGDVGATLSIQVKLRIDAKGKDMARWLASSERRYLVTAQATIPKVLEPVRSRVLTQTWIMDALKQSPVTRLWLERSTRWVRLPVDNDSTEQIEE